MADYMHAEIQIGGKLAKTKQKKFLRLISGLSINEGCCLLSHKEYLEKCLKDQKSLSLYDDQTRYGEFEELEHFCAENKLTFKRTSSPKYEYEGVIRFLSPESGDHHMCATDAGEPYLKLSELQHFLEQDITLESVIRIANESIGNVPPISIE
jgi:hypothetical protein